MAEDEGTDDGRIEHEIGRYVAMGAFQTMVETEFDPEAAEVIAASLCNTLGRLSPMGALSAVHISVQLVGQIMGNQITARSGGIPAAEVITRFGVVELTGAEDEDTAETTRQLNWAMDAVVHEAKGDHEHVHQLIEFTNVNYGRVLDETGERLTDEFLMIWMAVTRVASDLYHGRLVQPDPTVDLDAALTDESIKTFFESMNMEDVDGHDE